MVNNRFTGLLIFGYLLRSIPWGLFLTRVFTSDDIRRKGSGNIRATNVTREAGIMAGLLTLTGDVLKGALPVLLAHSVLGAAEGPGDVYLAAVALAAFLGHLFPVYFRFRDGGKGVATAAGCFAVISPTAVWIALGIFCIALLIARRVSVGSLCAAIALPVAIVLFTGSMILAIAAGVVALLIWFRHHENIKRLLTGTEPPFTLRKDSSDR